MTVSVSQPTTEDKSAASAGGSDAPSPAPVDVPAQSVEPPPTDDVGGAADLSPVVEETKSPAAPVPPSKPSDWRDKRIATLTAKLKSAQEEAAAKEAAKAVLPAPTTVPPDSLPRSEVERLANELAEQKTQLAVFQASCRQVSEAGREAFPEFDSRVTALSQLNGGGADPEQQFRYNTFIAAAIETGEAAKLLHDLGGNLDEAARIISLPPTKMAVELTKLALGKGGAHQVSAAPKPIKPVNGSAASRASIAPDDPERAHHLTTAEWMKRRNEQTGGKPYRGA